MLRRTLYRQSGFEVRSSARKQTIRIRVEALPVHTHVGRAHQGRQIAGEQAASRHTERVAAPVQQTQMQPELVFVGVKSLGGERRSERAEPGGVAR